MDPVHHLLPKYRPKYRAVPEPPTRRADWGFLTYRGWSWISCW
jgi:hypothetical protein